MTSIHAPIPHDLKISVHEAKHRGEDPSSLRHDEEREPTTQRPRRHHRLHPRTIKKPIKPTPSEDTMSDSETEDPSKENDPSLSSTPVHLTPPSPRKALGKRPLSVLTMPYPEDPDGDMMLIDSDSEPSLQMSSSEQNICANIRSPPRKSPKLSPSKGNSLRLRDGLQIYEDVPDRTVEISCRFSGDGKENRAGTMKDVELQGKTALNTLSQSSGLAMKTPLDSNPSRVSKKVVGGSRKLSAPKAKPRIGVRRL